MASSDQIRTVRSGGTAPSASSHRSTGNDTGVRTDQPPASSDKRTAGAFDTTATCVECGGDSFDRSSTGEWYCTECGAVQSSAELEFSEPGWTPIEERRTAPAGDPTRLSVGTTIGAADEGSEPRWARYNRRLRHDRETLRHGLKELRALAAALEATTTVRKEAATLFRRATDEGLLVGRSLEAMAAACIHAVARDQGRPFPLDRVAAHSPVDADAIRGAYGKLVQEFELPVAPPLPTAYIARFASRAGLSHHTQRRARELAELIVDDGAHVGQSPTGVAAAVLYGAAKESAESITQEELANVAYISTITLSRQWQTVQDYLDE